MPNYKETNLITDVYNWTRAFKVEISNAYNQIPVISFFEEKLQQLNGVLNKRVIGRILKADMLDKELEFPLLNPETDEVIGTAKFINVYIIIYSLYMYLAKKADIQPAPRATGPIKPQTGGE